jgi:hypothetical protein
MIEINPESITESVRSLIEKKAGLEARVIDLTRLYPAINYLFERNGQPCFSRGDIQAVKGKAKSGKTTFMVALLSTLLDGENMGFKAINPGCKSIYVDTEQNPKNTAGLTRRVHAACGISENENHQRFRAINLRGDNPAQRKGFIREAIEKYKPDFIIIDGIKDLIEGGDINSPRESSETVQFLMTLTKEYDVAILTVLHENKNDENMRGHVGSELLNKCSEVWQIRKVDDVFEVEQTENRNQASKLIYYSFRYDDDLPTLVDTIPSQNREEKLWRRRFESFYFCLQPGVRLGYTRLKEEYCQVHGCSDKTAERDISTFLKNGCLLKDQVLKEYRFSPAKMEILNQNSNPQT